MNISLRRCWFTWNKRHNKPTADRSGCDLHSQGATDSVQWSPTTSCALPKCYKHLSRWSCIHDSPLWR